MRFLSTKLEIWKVRARDAKRTVRTFFRNPLSIAGLIIACGFFILGFIAPYITPYPDDVTGAIHTKQRLQAPSREHLFGTDDVGRDVYSRVIYGTRISLQIALVIVGVATCIGVPLGLMAGFSGGVIEEVIMRFTDIFLAVPGIVLAVTIVSALGPGIINVMIALSIVWWPGYVRLVRGQAKALREEVFVEASTAIGSSRARIMFRHILPNCFSVITVKMSMDMGMAILSAAGLGFIGIGAQPPSPEWGAMISGGRWYLPTWWWYAVFPGLAIWLTVLGFNLLGDGLRDVFDPKQRGRY